MLRRTLSWAGWHYVHPKNGRPIKQARRYGDPRYVNNEAALIQGQWGLITADFGIITQTQMENARLAILRRLPKQHFSLVMHTDYEEMPISLKPKESRMGGGYGPIAHFVYKLTTGIPLFEIMSLSKKKFTTAEANAVFLLGRSFLPLETVVVPQGRVDEYNVFK